MMKKNFFFLLCVSAFVACNSSKNNNTEMNNNVVFAENIESIVALVPDSTKDEAWWNAQYKCDQEKIYSTIVKAVLVGKLKAYRQVDEPQTSLTLEEVTNILVQWDSTAQTEDPNNPKHFILAPMKIEQSPFDIVQLRFNEKIKMDTVSFALSQEVSSVSFIANKYDEVGNVRGLRKLFDVKLEKESSGEAKK